MKIEQDNVFYRIENGIAIVESLSNINQTDIVIDSDINGYPVEIIDECAFFGTSITSIVLPYTLKTIGTRAFMLCDKLEFVQCNSIKHFSGEMLTIKTAAFAQCDKLKKFHMAKYLALEENCFDSCYNLTSIDAVISAVGEAFRLNEKLSCVTFVENCNLLNFIDFNSCIKTYNFLGDAFFDSEFAEYILDQDIKIECYTDSNLCDLVYDGISVYAMERPF